VAVKGYEGRLGMSYNIKSITNKEEKYKNPPKILERRKSDRNNLMSRLKIPQALRHLHSVEECSTDPCC
jgi:hypothetical protein